MAKLKDINGCKERIEKSHPGINAVMNKIQKLKKERVKNSQIINELIEMQKKFPYDPWAFIEHAFIALKRKGNYAEAAEVSERGLNNNPENIRLKMTLFEALSYLPGEHKRAIDLFNELIEKLEGKERIKILSTYADFLIRVGNVEKAQVIYNEIIEKSPDDAITLINLARSYRVKKDYKACLDCLATNPRPKDPFWLRESIHCLIEKGDYKNALRMIEDTKTVVNQKFSGPKNQNFFRSLKPLEFAANALDGKWKEAATWAFEQSPQKGVILIWDCIRKWLINNDNIEDGISFYKELFKKEPENLIITYQLFRIFEEGGYPDEKRLEIVKKFEEINADNLDVIGFIASHYQNINTESAEEYFDRFWKKAHKMKDKANLRLAIVNGAISNSMFLRKQNKFEDAYLILEEARTYWGVKSRNIDVERAVNLVRMGNYSEAYEILKELHKIMPANAVVLDQIGLCLLAFGKFEDAYELYQKKVDLHPNDKFGWQGLGKALFELGRHDAALGAYEKILEIDPDDIDAKWLASNIYQQKGLYDRAKDYVSQIDTIAVMQRGWLDKVAVQNKIAELERQKLEQQVELEEARKLGYLGMMATATAHELNQPIGIIRAATDAALNDIKENLFNEKDLKPLLNRIFDQTERLAAIINNFRRFARGDRSHREKVAINDLIQSTINNFIEQFKHRNIYLKSKLWMKRPLPVAWANFFQLEEVLINLLTNARDAVEGRENAFVIVMSWRRKGGGCGFSVTDNGPGLSDEYRKNMFVPFFSTKPTEKGSGLGLYITRRIIDDLGGQLRYRDHPKGGAIFEIQLPPLKG